MTMTARPLVLIAALSGLAMALGAAAALAQPLSYPEKTVRIVVPFPAGGATDIIARLIGERLTGVWGKPVVIENIAGAAGATATAQTAKAAADGYTLLTATGTTTTLLPHLRSNLGYDTLRDFDAVSLVCSFPNMLVVRPELPARTLAELLALVRANPGKHTYASSGFGGSPHIAAEWFKLLTKTDILHVPFTGSGPAQPALLGGHVDMMFDTMPTVWPQVQAGKLRALAVTSAERVPFVPDLPSIAETSRRGSASWSRPEHRPPSAQRSLQNCSKCSAIRRCCNDSATSAPSAGAARLRSLRPTSARTSTSGGA
jgi:tripartite-type tricarboxylate transporter receptor subunit TctC